MGENFPQDFGQYTLHELIGRGGMAEIYRASMPGIGGFEKTVAIKKILPHLAEDEEFTTMLVDEANIIESLDHSNIAQVFDLGKLDGSYYIAMEYIHGVDLSEIIDELEKRGEFLPIPHVIYITSSICAGLHFAHSKTDEDGHPLNIIHRDISPHNIRLSFAGEVKIIDFGVAKAADREARTKMGVIKGKLLYMAPEQAQAEELDGRADLFATGLCTYKMLTGTLPFEGENEFQVYNNVLEQEITPPIELRPEIPEKLDRIVMKLLQRDPEKRYQDGYSAKQDLDKLLHEIDPGYTVHRLSEFVEEHFSDLVQSGEGSVPSDTSNPSGLSPSTPSRPAPGTGNRNAAELEEGVDPAETNRESVPAGESIEESTRAARPQKIDPADESRNRLGAADASAAVSTEDAARSRETDTVEPDAEAPFLAPVLYAIGFLSVAIAGMVTYAVLQPDGETDTSSSADERIAEAGDGTERAAAASSMVRIKLDSEPSDARLVRKGEEVGSTPIQFALPKTDEPLELDVEKEGYERRTVEVVPTRDLEQTVELTPAAGPDAARAEHDAGSNDSPAARKVDDESRERSEGARASETESPPTGSSGDSRPKGERAAKDDSDDRSGDSDEPLGDLEKLSNADPEGALEQPSPDESSESEGGGAQPGGEESPSDDSNDEEANGEREDDEREDDEPENDEQEDDEIIDPFNM